MKRWSYFPKSKLSMKRFTWSFWYGSMPKKVEKPPPEKELATSVSESGSLRLVPPTLVTNGPANYNGPVSDLYRA